MMLHTFGLRFNLGFFRNIKNPAPPSSAVPKIATIPDTIPGPLVSLTGVVYDFTSAVLVDVAGALVGIDVTEVDGEGETVFFTAATTAFGF
jgi:hypothetical protein